MMVIAWARVASLFGDSVVLEVPFMMPFEVAQIRALTAYSDTSAASVKAERSPSTSGEPA